jgi:hypothetical protein
MVSSYQVLEPKKEEKVHVILRGSQREDCVG